MFQALTVTTLHLIPKGFCIHHMLQSPVYLNQLQHVVQPATPPELGLVQEAL